MFRSALRLTLFGLTLVSFFIAIGPAKAYEAEVRAAATKLVSQLEKANQKSGTVLDFTDLQGQGTELGRFFAQELSDQLVTAAKRMEFVDRANLKHLLDENKLSMEGLVSPETSRRLGNLIGIDTVIYGSVTPIGQSVRLSIRAVAVETGKIVASQSTTVPLSEELANLYTRGVAVAPSGSTAKPQAPDVRARFRSDSIKVTGQDFFVGRCWYCGDLTLILENKSGLGFEAGIQRQSTSVSGCDQGENVSSGLALVNPGGGLTYFPPNGKIIVKVNLSGCKGFKEGQSTIAGMSIFVRSGDSTVVLPVSASVPVRLGGFN